MIRINPRVVAIKGKTPVLRRIVEAIIIPRLGFCSEIITKSAAAILTEIEVTLELSRSCKPNHLLCCTHWQRRISMLTTPCEGVCAGRMRDMFPIISLVCKILLVQCSSLNDCQAYLCMIVRFSGSSGPGNDSR